MSFFQKLCIDKYFYDVILKSVKGFSFEVIQTNKKGRYAKR